MSAILKQKLIDIANGFTKYGLWKGGGSGGSNALSEMTDVIFTNLQTNDVLTYNGSEWVNDDNLQTQINTLNSNLSSVSSDLDNVENICYNLKISSVGHDTTEYIIDHIEYNKTLNLLYVFFKNGQWLWIEITGKSF